MRIAEFTSVSLKYLQDLPRLQVPNINLRVFTATYYRLASSHTEARKQTIRRISVPFVRFDAFRRLGVPKSDGRVLSYGEDEFGIGRKPDMRTTRICVRTS